MILSLGGGVQGQLNAISLASLLSIALAALLAVFYSILRGKLRPESTVREIREDRDARVEEARKDRDERLAEASKQIEMWHSSLLIAEEARRSQEALLRETTMEVGKTVQHVINALQEARLQAQGERRDPDPTIPTGEH
jgi:AraC-like DNA-binding protein